MSDLGKLPQTTLGCLPSRATAFAVGVASWHPNRDKSKSAFTTWKNCHVERSAAWVGEVAYPARAREQIYRRKSQDGIANLAANEAFLAWTIRVPTGIATAALYCEVSEEVLKKAVELV
jgi:hypothetical protein